MAHRPEWSYSTGPPPNGKLDFVMFNNKKVNLKHPVSWEELAEHDPTLTDVSDSIHVVDWYTKRVLDRSENPIPAHLTKIVTLFSTRKHISMAHLKNNAIADVMEVGGLFDTIMWDEKIPDNVTDAVCERTGMCPSWVYQYLDMYLQWPKTVRNKIRQLMKEYEEEGLGVMQSYDQNIRNTLQCQRLGMM